MELPPLQLVVELGREADGQLLLLDNTMDRVTQEIVWVPG